MTGPSFTREAIRARTTRRLRLRVAWRRWLVEHTDWRTRQRFARLFSYKAWQYRLAWQLNRHPWFCWAHLVGRIEFGSPKRLSECGRTLTCQTDMQRTGSCYCGALRTEVPVEVR